MTSSPEWLGVLFSNIGGNLTLMNITATDPEDDGNAAVSVVHQHDREEPELRESRPAVDWRGAQQYNIVGHKTTGQCVGLLSDGTVG